MTKTNRISFFLFVMLCLLLLPGTVLHAQFREGRGTSIGKVTVMGKLILLELNPGALGHASLFNLTGRTLRFTPTPEGYRIANLPLDWDASIGQKLEPRTADVTLHNFAFPFSGKTWTALSMGVAGSLRFIAPEEAAAAAAGARGGFRGGVYQSYAGEMAGVSIGRFTPLSEGAGNLVNSQPAICVFFKPRMMGERYVNELADRVVLTWDVTEPYGNIQDFTWVPTTNQFQAVLYKSGEIELSYKQLAAKDAIVGVYPLVTGGAEKTLATLTGQSNPSAPAYLDLRKLTVESVGNLLLKVTLETGGPAPAQASSNPNGANANPFASALTYRVHWAAGAHQADWTIRGFPAGFRGRGGPGGGRGRANGPFYFASGPGVARPASRAGYPGPAQVTVSGNTLSIEGQLPPDLGGAKSVTISAESLAPGSDTPAGRISARPVSVSGLRNPEVRFASIAPKDGPFPVAYQAFHYYNLPDPRDLACSVIKALGDHFDMLAYYSDFRVDNQEAGTPSNGPRGSSGQPVTGIGSVERGESSYCSKGRFQWGFVQPIYSGSIQMQEYPPANAPIMQSPDDVTYYEKQLDEISLDGKMPPYLYAMSQIGHEMDHRWGVDDDALVNGKRIPLGPVHWTAGINVPVPFPYVRPTEASIMGGGVWQDNHDGTYTQLDDNYYVPATGYSYLDLYDMGLIAPSEVPSFFLLQNLQYVRTDANGHRVFKADRLDLTIQNVIDAMGPRVPDVNHSQRLFNTGMVMVVQHGMKPTARLIEETSGIRLQWMKYFSIVTGRRATMTANPN